MPRLAVLVLKTGVDDGFIEKPKCMRKHSRVLTNEGIEKAKELLDHVGPSLGFNKKDWTN